MSMLAQGRRKQKISTNPNGLHFASDEGNIGQKLMNQMGWEKGRGLGANLQGEKDPVKVKMNVESRGLGCKRSDVDKWIAHQDDFNSLLANLNENAGAELDDSVEDVKKPFEQSSETKSHSSDNKPAVQSLEAKSKSSRSRVHYMKFTKGKDLSRHSEKDLACILGPSRSGNCTPTIQSKVASAANSDNESNSGSADPFLSDAVHVTSSLSLHEYFASKMAAKKNSSSNLLADMAVSSNHDTGDEATVDIVQPSFFIGDPVPPEEEEMLNSQQTKKKSKHKHKPVVDEHQMDNTESHKKKKMKKKRRKEQEREKARHSTGGKTKPKPADDTMKFVSESSDDEVNVENIESSNCKGGGKKRIHSTEETTAEEPAFNNKLKKSKSDSHLLLADSETRSEKKKRKKRSRDDS